MGALVGILLIVVDEAVAAAAADDDDDDDNDDDVCLCVTLADGRLLYFGVAMGALVGILLIVVDEAVTTQPLIPVHSLNTMLLLLYCYC